MIKSIMGLTNQILLKRESLLCSFLKWEIDLLPILLFQFLLIKGYTKWATEAIPRFQQTDQYQYAT